MGGVAIVKDAHWCDPASAQALGHLLESAPAELAPEASPAEMLRLAGSRRARAAAKPAAMKIELLYFSGCPNYARFQPRLRELVERAGVSAKIEPRRIETPEDAVAERFLGSPTVRIEGRDIEPNAGRRTDYGLKCRLYRGEEGLQGTPPEQMVLAALRLSSRT